VFKVIFNPVLIVVMIIFTLELRCLMLNLHSWVFWCLMIFSLIYCVDNDLFTCELCG